MRFLPVLGKFLISVGVGVLLFVLWTLKGTDLYTNRAQQDLAEEFDRTPVVAATTDEEGELGPPRGYAPGPGAPVFRLAIPAIDTRHMVVEGVGTGELRMGPGHYPACRPGFERPLCTEFDEVFPGEKGRVVVSGHRTTYGAPFWGLDKLKDGDDILIEAKWGNFVYEVTDLEIVRPDSLAIAVPSDEAELVLTTCHPKYSAAQRLIVFARLTSSEAA